MILVRGVMQGSTFPHPPLHYIILTIIIIKWSLPKNGLLGCSHMAPEISKVLTLGRNMGLRPGHRIRQKMNKERKAWEESDG